MNRAATSPAQIRGSQWVPEPAPAPAPGAEGAALDLLLALGRVPLEEAHAARAEALLSGGPEWELVLALAGRHGLVPLLHWHLAHRFPGRAPAPVELFLEEQFHAGLQSNLRLAAELLRILRLLGEHRIPAIAYKGAALACAFYGNLALREFSDLDLLLRQEDVLRARDLLLADGYVPEYAFTAPQERAMLATACEYNFWKFEGRLQVELHWDIVPRNWGLHLDPGSWFARRQSVAMGAAMVPSLCPEDLLLVLCVHGAKHGWERMAWITDLAELLRTCPRLDWDLVSRQADAAGARRLLLLGLGLAQRLFGAAPPVRVLSEIHRDSHVQSMIEEVCQGLARPGREPWVLHRFLLRGLGPRQRFAYLLRSMLTPTPAEWNLMNLPAPLFPLYSVLRLARLTGKYAARAWRGRPEDPRAG